MKRRRTRHERGAVTVEFVLVLPFFLFLIFEMINYGVMLSFRQTLSQAAAEGARAAAVAPPNLDAAARIVRAKQAVNQSFEGQIGGAVTCDTGGFICDVQQIPNPCGTQCRMKVVLTFPYKNDPNRDVMPHIFGNPLPSTLTYTASARVK